jgi:inner membrane protein
MDSLSQIVLGAITFALVKDKEIGKKSLVYGAVLGTIPDLDVLLNPFFDSVEQFAIHRAFSHSIFFAILLSLLAGKILSKKYETSYISWVWACFLALFTHPLLDLCTTYGTRILYPLSKSYYSLNNVFVIDLFYTLPLLIASIALWIMKNRISKRRKIINISLILSTGYLLWGLVVREIVYSKFETVLQVKNIAFEKMTVAPTPFNTFLWQAVIKTKDGFYFSDYSIFDKQMNTTFHFEKSENQLLPALKSRPELEPFFNFAQGYELVKKDGDLIKIYVTKFGPMSMDEKGPKFVFPMCIKPDGSYYPEQNRPENYGEIFSKLLIRIQGK